MERKVRNEGYLYRNKHVLVRGVILSLCPLLLCIVVGWALWIGIALSAVALAGTVFQYFWKGPRSEGTHEEFH